MNIPTEVLEEMNLCDPQIVALIEKFKEFVVKNTIENTVDKFLRFGTPYIFKEDEDKYYELVRDIEKYFKVNRGNIYVVGSSKLGFSIAPGKRFKQWTIDSDIDIALIDNTTFLNYWKQLYSYNPGVAYRTEDEEQKYNTFSKYFRKGWLRPDLFPIKMADEVFGFLNQISGKYGYKVRVGLYVDTFFFDQYNKKNIKEIKEDLLNGLY